MAKPIIKIENLSKQYRLGTIGTGTIAHDLNRWWQTKMLGNPDPYLKIGETNDRAHKGNSEYVWALKDINMEVNEGDVVGIIGKNGAGKSTLLKILSRVTAPTTGSIKVRGRLASLLEVGTGFHPELTGRENIFLNGAILGMTKAEIRSKLDEIIDFSGCERYIDTPVKRYSSGMNVRLGFAVAAFLEPEILVVDEVLAVGDIEFQNKAIGKMQDVSSKDGRTVLFVSHNMKSIESLCHRGIVLDQGGVAYDGNASEAIDFYSELNNSSDKNALTNFNRKGSGELRIADFILTDLDNHPIKYVCTGQSFKIKIQIKEISKEHNHLKNINISLNLKNRKGTTLFNTHTKLYDNTYSANDLIDSKWVEVEIRNFPFKAEDYLLSCSLIQGYEYIDSIDNLVDLEVRSGNFMGKTLYPRKEDGYLLLDTEWYVKNK
ncbi:MAG: ABC transporter ATP-binding protein [Marinilabiliaceae bacterium]|nr:ABC transporter ATP-binding protein [Marinilabiliaceae bacterium]